MSATVTGIASWAMTRDDEGYREYRILHRVRTTSAMDGPATVLVTPGLPLPGQMWNFGNDIDPWVWCRPERTVTIDQEKQGDPNYTWLVESTFSNKLPDNERKGCHDLSIENPILQPPIITGKTDISKQEALLDRFGRPILTSSHENVKGHEVEYELSVGKVTIEQNVLSAFQGITLPQSMLNMVNDAGMWGVPRRHLKLVEHDWEVQYYGLCYKYYKRKLTFEADLRLTAYDKIVLDEGTKALHGQMNKTTKVWEVTDINGEPPNPKNPQHFVRFTDANGNPTKVILDGFGEPFRVPANVEDCDQCSDGTWEKFVVSGLAATYSRRDNQVVLEYAGVGGDECRWESDDGEIVLTYVGNLINQWTLTLNSQATEIPVVGTWVTRDLREWDCDKGGVLYLTEDDPTNSLYLPKTLGVGNYAAGQIRFELLNETNFWLLGLPAVF